MSKENKDDKDNIINIIKNNKCNVIWFVLVGVMIGRSTQFLFSLGGFCVSDSDSVSYLLAIASIIISILIYFVSTKQTDNIEDQTTRLTEVSGTIEKLTKELNIAILGQAKGFEELFAKIRDIVVISKGQAPSTLKLVLPIPTLGFFNKEVRALYEKHKKELLKICQSDMEIEFVFLNPLQNFEEVENNKALFFLKTIIELQKDNNNQVYEVSYKENIRELVSFFRDIVKHCGWKNKIKINLTDDLFLSAIIASHGKDGEDKSSLFFFIGPELLNFSDQSKLKKKDYVSTGVYNNTLASYTLIDNLIEIQKNKTNIYDLSSKAHSDLFCYIMEQMLHQVNYVQGDSWSAMQSIFKEYIEKWGKWSSLGCTRIESKSTSSLLYFFKHKDDGKKNLLILPSAAGIYSHFNLGRTDCNASRFDMYYEIMSRSDYNCYLYSYSGQGYVNNGGKFSAQNAKKDLGGLNKYFIDNNITIDCILSFCVSGQIYFDYCNEFTASLLSNLPLIIWDLPHKVNWKRNRQWFQRIFCHITLNAEEFNKTNEPHSSIPKNYGAKILYCYPQTPYDKDREYCKMKEAIKKGISSAGDNYKEFQYSKLKHIPRIEDDQEEFTQFIDLLNNHHNCIKKQSKV